MKTIRDRAVIAMRRGVSWVLVVEGVDGRMRGWRGGNPGRGRVGDAMRAMGLESEGICDAVNSVVEFGEKVREQAKKVEEARERRSEELGKQSTT
jgi:hypothetical protein